MKLKLERVTLNVRDLETAKEFFSQLLNTTFEDFPENTTSLEIIPKPDNFIKFRAAISPMGIELFESFPKVEHEGIRNVTWRVDDMQEAQEEMKKRGIQHVYDIKWGRLKETIYSADDMYGVRWVLNEFPGDSAIKAAREKEQAIHRR